jgi:hypothetical protein
MSTNGESRLDRVERMLEQLAAQHESSMAEILAQRVNIESLHASVSELYGTVQTMSRAIAQDAENIRALARIAELHERRLTDLKGGE